MCVKDKLMYQSDMERLEIAQNCPCEHCNEVNELEAYRLMYEPLEEPNNFVPPLLKAERDGRSTRTYMDTPARACGGMGLSFFLKPDKAQAQFNSVKGFKKMNPAFTCIGKCRLTSADGVISPADTNGHFDVHPYTDAPMQSDFAYHSSLTV